jgi:hypothetical protein
MHSATNGLATPSVVAREERQARWLMMPAGATWPAGAGVAAGGMVPYHSSPSTVGTTYHQPSSHSSLQTAEPFAKGPRQ